MKIFTDNEFHTFEQLCGLTQKSMKATMSKYLKSKYKKVTETRDYIVAEGNIPIALCAHMDTVFSHPASDVFYDRTKNVIWSPQGLGADDRAGIFGIIQIIKKGYRPHIILTTDEEIGARGALTLSQIDCPFKDLRYIIQLDRRGADDCVFYDCDNPDFIDYVEEFGFVEAIGSFTDISMICPRWGVAGVNLSIGYRDEHSVSEILFVGHFLSTVEKVIKMLTANMPNKFDYIPSKYTHWYRWTYSNCDEKEDHKCHNCKREFDVSELIPVKMGDFTFGNYCIDCVSDDKIKWCKICGEAYLAGEKDFGMCEDCVYDYGYAYRT